MSDEGEKVVELEGDEAAAAAAEEEAKQEKKKRKKWECRKCGQKNDDDFRNCSKCGIDKMVQFTMKIKRKKYCDDCNHLHMWGHYCHMYVLAEDAFKDDEAEQAEMDALLNGKDLDELELEDIDEDEDEDEDEEDEEDDDDAIFGAAKRKTNRMAPDESEENKSVAASVVSKTKSIEKEEVKKELPFLRPLETPPAIAAAGFSRCNCHQGVPDRNRRFIQFPARYDVGDILIQTYQKIRDKEAELEEIARKRMEDEYEDPEEEDEEERLLREDEEKSFFKRPPFSSEYVRKVGVIVALTLQFVPLNKCGPLTSVSRHWQKGAMMYEKYVHMRDFKPSFVFQLHIGMVTAVMFHHDKIFSGGDRTITCSDSHTGEIRSVIARDAGDLTAIIEHDGNIYVSSTAGVFRGFAMTFTGKNMVSTRAFVGHSKAINCVLRSTPSIDRCHTHKIKQHVCHLYSASDDRTIRVWDLYDGRQCASITPPGLREATFRCLGQSERHIFAGTTAAAVMVFSKHNHCERKDIHMCNMPKADKTYCLQATLKLPKVKLASGNLPTVNCLATATNEKVPEPYTLLWAADSAGYITVWKVDMDEGIDFIPTKSWCAHQGQITGMQTCANHMVTIGDDGHVVVTSLWKFARVKKFDINTQCLEDMLFTERPNIRRKLKSLGYFEPQAMALTEDSPSNDRRGGGGGNDVASVASMGSFGSAFDHILGSDGNGSKHSGMISVGTHCGEVILMKLGGEI